MMINRVWAMPSLWTFKINPIKKLIARHKKDGIWCDPFAGRNSCAEITNDLVEPTQNIFSKHTNMDALEFLKSQKDDFFDGVFYDPPYSITQARNYGSKKYSSMKYWRECKDEVARICKPQGKVICFGWTSSGLGKKRGFSIEEILLVAHGGSKNDTICTVEKKVGKEKML